MYLRQIVIATFLCLATYGSMPSQEIQKNSRLMLNTENQETDALMANYIRSYPNPTTGPLAISMGRVYDKVIVEVRSVSGKLISKEQYDNTAEINTTIDAPSGIYLLRITGDDQHLMIYRITKE